MFKTVAESVWVIDAEWVPDPGTGRRLYGLPADLPDAEVMERMWQEGGGTGEEPRPYLKTALCRVVSVAALRRRSEAGAVRLDLHSLPPPEDAEMDEATLLSRFLDGLGKSRPQLVGFNLRGADVPILLQRALANRIAAPGFCRRPEKPWEGVDYFSSASDACVDLMEVFGSWRNFPSLQQLAASARIPGKFETRGRQVSDLWLAGERRRIVEYNEYDVLTTYLLWLRAAHLAGFLTTEAMVAEESSLESLLEDRGRGEAHLGAYLERWRLLRQG